MNTILKYIKTTENIIFFGLFTGIFCCLYFLNPYHLVHQEQMQLFRFDSGYAAELIGRPGGLSKYAGAFVTQFFITPFWGAITSIILSVVMYVLTNKILTEISNQSGSKLSSSNLFLPVISVVISTISQFNHNYHIETTVSFVIILFLCLLYTFLNKKALKLLAALFFPFVAFILCGFLWILLAFLIIICEIAVAYKLFARIKVKALYFWVVTACLTVIYGYFSYDYKTEKIFEIEYFFFKEDYKKVVELVKKYPGNNHLVVYFGNIALSKSGRMGDSLFRFRQLYGHKGLYMTDQPLNIATLYGGALYDHLNYTNEACHWTYNGMVVNGKNPQLLKKLTEYELVNGNHEVAVKYLKILGQTLFYREWALEYYKYANFPLLIYSDDRMAGLRRFTLGKDFYHDRFDLRLHSLLQQYPDNRAAFDYLISYALLRKDLKLFCESLSYIKETKIKQLPVHFEEALLASKMIMPELAEEIDRYVITEQTKTRFDLYVSLYESAKGDLKKAYNLVFADFRYSLWFYLDFFPSVSSETEANTQLFPY